MAWLPATGFACSRFPPNSDFSPSRLPRVGLSTWARVLLRNSRVSMGDEFATSTVLASD